MNSLGSLFRWLLNINTVWGLMILSALGLTAIQHYTPTTSTIDATVWQGGQNEVDIKVVGKDDAVYESRFTLNYGPNGLVIPESDKQEEPKVPYLISARQQNGVTLLKWENLLWGKYTITVNGQTAATGDIVTLKKFSDEALRYAEVAFNLALGFVAVFVLFLGLMKVGEDAGIVNVVAQVVRPIIRFLFPDVPKDHPANGAILMNVTTSMLGLGNAATPFGLKAMEELQTLNPHKDIASDSQIMLMAWNTAGWAFLPLTMIAVRQSAGTTKPLEIIGPCMVAGLVATITGVIMVKLLGTLPFFTVESALAEEVDSGATISESDARKKSEDESDKEAK